MINAQVQSALAAALAAHPQLIEKLDAVFASEKEFLEKVDELDAIFDDEPKAEHLREFVFDLLMVNFFRADVERLEADYMDSPEWEKIEDETLDRGTELLNLLLYINECQEEKIEPELGDFLGEFLLVDDDEFQDEHRIYEPVIANQVLVESSFEEIARVAKSLPADAELKELFYPIMCFFHSTKASAGEKSDVKTYAPDPDIDLPVFAILEAYNQA